jgi:uncharacterized protein DUF6285
MGFGYRRGVQYRPTTPELLDAIADLLDDEVLPAVPAAMQHKVRVAGNLARILQREAVLGPAGLERERDLLAALLGHGGELEGLRSELSHRLRAGDEQPFERDAWQTLMEIARADLAIAKPGHDSWEGE